MFFFHTRQTKKNSILAFEVIDQEGSDARTEQTNNCAGGVLLTRTNNIFFSGEGIEREVKYGVGGGGAGNGRPFDCREVRRERGKRVCLASDGHTQTAFFEHRQEKMDNKWL